MSRWPLLKRLFGFRQPLIWRLLVKDWLARRSACRARYAGADIPVPPQNSLSRGFPKGGDALLGHGVEGSSEAPFVDGISEGSCEKLPLIFPKEAMGVPRESEVSFGEGLIGDTVSWRRSGPLSFDCEIEGGWGLATAPTARGMQRESA